jgi:antitoxin HigA-1
MGRTAIHPGEHLAEELAELKMSAAELARQIDVPVNRITEIMNGQRSITADTAIRLGHWFGTSAEFWLNLQKMSAPGPGATFMTQEHSFAHLKRSHQKE